MNTSDRIIILKRLIGEAGRNYYQRVENAVALLDDIQWIEAEYNGDKYKAAESLQSEFFHDIIGALSIWDLLQIFRKFPNESQWRGHQWNLTYLYQASIPRQDKNFKSKPLIKTSEHKEVKKQLEEKTQQVVNLQRMVKSKEEIIADLQREVQRLTAENTKMRRRLDVLERQVA